MGMRWHFVEMDRRWTWRLVTAHGAVVGASIPCNDYGSAIMDALRYGFQPTVHHWHVITANGISRFEPGIAAQIFANRRRNLDESQSAAKRRGTDI
jgi:hypothetical protein